MSDQTRLDDQSETDAAEAARSADPETATPEPQTDAGAPVPEQPFAGESSADESSADESSAEEASADATAEGASGEVDQGEVAQGVDEQAEADEPDDEEDDDEEETVALAPAGPLEDFSEEELVDDIQLDWYILKVQSNRERTSSEALKRKVAIEGIERYFGDIIVPTEKVTEFKSGKKKTVERKIWPGYIAVQMHVNDDTWFAIRETSGIGDFTGASGKPIPMSAADVEKILPKDESEESEDETPKLNIKFAEGDKVKVTDGNFENFEGDVDAIDQQSGKITVMISIFGRSTPVELEYWQVEKL